VKFTKPLVPSMIFQAKVRTTMLVQNGMMSAMNSNWRRL
jgi:hypothetical protein